MRLQLLRCLLIAAALVPLTVAGGYIAVFGQPVPFWDEWDQPADIAIKTAESTLTFSDLLRQYNDSRPFFTNLLTAGSARLVAWDLKAEMFFSLSLASLTLLLLFSLLRLQLGARAFLVLPLMSLLVFSLTQRTSLLWAVQSQYFFLILFVVAATRSVGTDRPSWRGLAFASFFSMCATFSFANGFLIWIVMTGVLWVLGYRSTPQLAFWILACAACLTVFFWGYAFRGSLGGETPHLQAVGKFVLAYLGNALVGHTGPTTRSLFALIASIGALGLILFGADVAFLYRCTKRRSEWALWAGLGLFVIASSVLAGNGRIPTHGTASALANRYVILSLLFWVALVGLGAVTIRTGTTRVSRSLAAKALVSANILIGVLLTGILLVFSARSLRLPCRVTPSHKACLERAPFTRDVDCLKGVHPVFDPAHPSYASRHLALAKIDRLNALNLGVFSNRGKPEIPRTDTPTR